VQRKQNSVELITAILKQAEIGLPVSEPRRHHRILEQSYYGWRKVYGGMEPLVARELKCLREENTKLTRRVADLSLDKSTLQDALEIVVKRVQRREKARYLISRCRAGAWQACRCVCASLSALLPQLQRPTARASVGFGYRLPILFQREGREMGKKRLYLIYGKVGLGLRLKRSWRHMPANHSAQRNPAHQANETWSADFVADELADGRRICMLMAVCTFTQRRAEI
jgi:putative transposase